MKKALNNDKNVKNWNTLNRNYLLHRWYGYEKLANSQGPLLESLHGKKGRIKFDGMIPLLLRQKTKNEMEKLQNDNNFLQTPQRVSDELIRSLQMKFPNNELTLTCRGVFKTRPQHVRTLEEFSN